MDKDIFVVFIYCQPVWKTIPSEARVTRDEVSGIKKVGKSCLEDSTTKTCYFSCLSTSKIDKR